MSPWVWPAVAALGGVGALARFLVDAAVSARAGGRLPLGTLLVNLSGAFVSGVVAGAATSHGLSLLAGTALVGSYTTFSTWTLETLLLSEDGRGGLALLNVLGQLVGGFAVAAAGWGVVAAL